MITTLNLVNRFFLCNLMLLAAMFIPQEKLNASISGTDAPGSPELNGAELYANTSGKGKVNVFLKVYYNCTASNIPSKEHASLFFNMGQQLLQIVELKLDSVVNQTGTVSAPCTAESQNCLKQVTYSTWLDLGENQGDYIVTWGYGGMDVSVSNLATPPMQGITLSVNLIDVWKAEVNVSSSVSRFPMHHVCTNTDMEFPLTFSNADSDQVFIELATPTNHMASGVNSYMYSSQAGSLVTADIVQKDPSYRGSFLTGHPQFEKIKYRQGYSAHIPFGEGNFRINAHTGVMNLKAKSFGRHLIVLTIKEKQNSNFKSEHQAFFITHIH